MKEDDFIGGELVMKMYPLTLLQTYFIDEESNLDWEQTEKH